MNQNWAVRGIVLAALVALCIFLTPREGLKKVSSEVKEKINSPAAKQIIEKIEEAKPGGKKEEAPSPSGVAPYATSGWEYRASEWTALTAALYWEADVNESREGLWAIAWVTRNRVLSRDFPRNKNLPNSIRGVVVDGFRPGRRKGCQYSFVCNGAGELPSDFQRLQARIGVRLTLKECEERWVKYSKISAEFLNDPGVDPTGGANHYWAAWMKTPKWAKKDMIKGSVKRIGSHKFGRSNKLGEDVLRYAALD